MAPLALLFAAGSGSPAAAQIMVVGDAVQEQAAAAGTRYTGEIRLRNQGTDPQQVRIYQTDYLFYSDGSNLYPAPGSHPRSNAVWTTVTPTDLVVPAGQESSVSYEVNVPERPGAAGTFWSMIMVEPVQMASAEPGSAEPGIGLHATVRFGIQVATHLTGDASHRLGLGDPRVVLQPDGSRALEFDLVNEGEVAFRPKVAVEIYDPTGAVRTTFQADRGLIYPGTSALQRVGLADLAPGRYEAVLVIDTGAPRVFGGQYTLIIDAPP